MRRIFVSAACLALGIGLVASASAQAPGAAAPPSTADAPTGAAAYPPPPGTPPAGYHYEWIFNYDRHGDYIGHWRLIRNH
jgi:hypothetical protein